MIKILIIPHGWMGDTLFASSIAKNLKLLFSDIIVDFYLIHPFMEPVIKAIDSIDNIVYSTEGYDKVYVMPITNMSENPIRTYLSSVIEGIDFEPIFEPINKDKLYKINSPISEKYITYQIDWQLRTKLNVGYIINELSKSISCIPIGRNGSILDDININKNHLIENVAILSNSSLHIGMLGGVNVLSSYMDVPTFTTTDHHFRNHNKLNSIEFMKNLKIVPSVWCNNNKHHEFDPNINENNLIKVILNEINI